MSLLSHDFSVIIDHGISVPVHVREVLYGLNSIVKRFISQLISTVQFTGATSYDTQMVMHTGTRAYDVSFPDNIKNTCLMRHANME